MSAYDTLRANLLALPPFTGTAIDYWASRRERFQELARDLDPSQFMQWLDPNVDGALDAGYEGYATHHWYDLLHASTAWRRWERLYIAPPCGNPVRFSRDQNATALTIVHAYTLMRWEALAGRSFLGGVDVVIDIGGGIGDFCRMLRDDGFAGRYVILDLPHMREFQRCYLSMRSVAADLLIEEDIPDLLASLGDKRVAVIGSWSLSETPLAFRAKLFPALHANAARYMLALKWVHDGVDNVNYFEQFMRDSSARWATETVSHYEEHRFLCGWRD